jgi:protease-4
MGNVAASGGYYVSAPAAHVVARRSTVTGSIGVITIRPVADRLYGSSA